MRVSAASTRFRLRPRPSESCASSASDIPDLRAGARAASMDPMVPVRVTVAVGRKVVALDDVRDPRVAAALRQTANDVGTRLSKAKCPAHGKGPTDVRLHFDASGAGDLKYESCCAKLGETISKLV